MGPAPNQGRSGCLRRPLQRGFTLIETIIVIGLLTLVSLGILAMQPQVFKVQNSGRDQFVGFELTRACAERLLAVRRQMGFGSVTSSLCNGMGGVGGFEANPSVTLKDVDGNTVTPCASASATCTATIIIAKVSSTPPASLTAITLQLSAY